MELMFPTHGTSSTLYVSILETLQICTLHFMINKVSVSIISIFSPLLLNLHIRSPSITILHNELQYKIAERFSPKSPNGFLQNCRTFSSNRRPWFRRISFLQISKIAERFSPKSPNVFCKSPNGSLRNRRISFLQITKHVSSKSPTYLAKQVSSNRRTLYSKPPS